VKQTTILSYFRRVIAIAFNIHTIKMVIFKLLVASCISFFVHLNGTEGIVLSKQIQVGQVSAGPIKISELGIGTWSWGNRLLFDYDTSQDEEIYEAYRAVRSAGVSIFDTADSYGTLDLNGRAEILLGQFERRFLQEKEMELLNKSSNQNILSTLLTSRTINEIVPQQVATKLAPYPWRITPKSIVSAAKASLGRLEQENLALAQLHWSCQNYQPFQERALWEGIADVYDSGLCEAIGVSNYGPIQLNKIATFMKDERGGVPLATAQIQYSLMTYQTAKDMNEVCNNLDCRLISYSPLCLGLLTGKYNLDNLPRNGNPRRNLFRELLPGAKDLLNLLEAIAKDLDKSQSQVAINWALCKGTVPIPGARTLKQAEENLGAVGWKLDTATIEELDRAALGVKKPMIQNIFQTK
jgi:pyridoxine 4-dehydrogenase